MDLSGILQQWHQPVPEKFDFQVLGFQLLQDFVKPVQGNVLHAGEQGVFLVVVVQRERYHEVMPELPGMHPEIPVDRLQFDLFYQLSQAFTQAEKMGVVVPDDTQCIAEVRGGLCITQVLLHRLIPGEALIAQRKNRPGGAIPGEGRTGQWLVRCSENYNSRRRGRISVRFCRINVYLVPGLHSRLSAARCAGCDRGACLPRRIRPGIAARQGVLPGCLGCGDHWASG